MARTKKGKKSPGHEYWGKRPVGWSYGHSRNGGKQIGSQRERAILKRELSKEPHEPEYDEQEYEPYCPDCAKGICPLYDENGNQVGVNGDYEF